MKIKIIKNGKITIYYAMMGGTGTIFKTVDKWNYNETVINGGEWLR